jgi:hypothetical protein
MGTTGSICGSGWKWEVVRGECMSKMSGVFVYRWIELSEIGGTWYGSLTRYRQHLLRKKGYEEACFDGMLFCTYSGGPLLLYAGDGRGEVFEMASEKRLACMREMFQGGCLGDVLKRGRVNLDVARKTLGRLTEDVGFMSNPANAEKFHFLRVSIHAGKDNMLYECDHGKWRSGGEDVYELLEGEYEHWGKGEK